MTDLQRRPPATETGVRPILEYGYAELNAAPPEKGQLADYLRALYERRWIAIGVFIAVVAAVNVYSFTAAPQYESQARLLIEPETPWVRTFDGIEMPKEAKGDYYQTHYDLLQSRALVKRTVDELELWDHPELSGGDRDDSFDLGRALRHAVARVGSFATGFARRTESATPLVRQAPSETAAQTQVIDAFLDSLTISNRLNTRLVGVRFRSLDPTLAATVANTLAQTYIEQNLELRLRGLQEAADLITQQLERQRVRVQKSNAAVQLYREQNSGVSLNERGASAGGKLANLEASVARVRTERIEKEALYDQLQSIRQDRGPLDTFPAILSNPFIQELKSALATLHREEAELLERRGDRHPDVIRLRLVIDTANARLENEIAKVAQSVRHEFLAVQSQERRLRVALEAQEAETLVETRKSIEYQALQWDATSDRGIFEMLLQRAKEARISAGLATNNLRIIDPAEVSLSPVYPKKGTNFLLSLVLGVSLAVGLTFCMEYLNDEIRSPDEIKGGLGLTVLAMIPQIPRQNTSGSGPLINDGMSPIFTESLRTLRSRVLFASAEGGTRAFLVTSSGTGEGKTMVASNFAGSLALAQGVAPQRDCRAGQNRVLLIDADMRSPELHKLFDVPLQPGLADLLTRSALPSQVVRPTKIPGLWVLPAGQPQANPADLLGALRFKQLVKLFGEQFDWLVIDSPPVLPVVDACEVAQVVPSVVFVVGANKTTRRTAQAALEQLATVGASLVGVVLNRSSQRSYQPYYDGITTAIS